MQSLDNDTRYDKYILGEKPIEAMRSAKWANYDLSNINGRTIQDISQEVEKMLKVERSKWKPYLIKGAFYNTTAVTCALALIIIVEIGLTWAGIHSIKITIDLGFLAISAAAQSLFSMLHEQQQIDTRTKVHLEWRKNNREIKQNLDNWYCRRETAWQALYDMCKRSDTLLQSAQEEEKLNKIRFFQQQVRGIVEAMKRKVDIISKLPATSRYIIFS